MISKYYQAKLRSLSVDRSSGHPKPHKICLLFAIMDLIKNGSIVNNKFIINNELKSAFNFHFERLKKGNDVGNIIQPFYHLHNDDIWRFKIKPGKHVDYDRLKSNKGTPSIKVLFNVIEYAYIDDELFKSFQNELSRTAVKEALLENLEDLSVQFHRWLCTLGKTEKTAASYVGAVKGAISTWANDANISHQNLISIQSYSTITKVAEKLANYEVFVARNTKGNQMYSAALNSYKNFLSFTCQSEVAEDIEKIINDETIDSAIKATLVNTRVGQGKFREKLIRYWKCCAVTGYESTQFLVASHIKPWRDANNEERLDKYNGILLLPNLDKAFDLGYISFAEKGTIKISGFIEVPKMLGINKNMKIQLARQHHEYLEYHREFVYEK